MRTLFAALTCALLLFIALPAPAQAAPANFFGPIVPEECKCLDQPNPSGGPNITTAPDYGCVLQIIQNVSNFAIAIATPIFVLFFMLAGFQLVISGGSAEALSRARSRLFSIAFGLAVILLAWLLIDYVMKTIYDDSTFGPWNAILSGGGGDNRCIVATKPGALTDQIVPINVGGSSSGGTGGGGPFSNAGNVNQRICAAASAYRGTATSAGPAGGRLACAWAVNNVLRSAGYKNIGGDSVLGMENALKSGRGVRIAKEQAACGDLVIEAGTSHVGFCMNSGCTRVISNSSSRASFVWESATTFQPSYRNGDGRIYRVTN